MTDERQAARLLALAIALDRGDAAAASDLTKMAMEFMDRAKALTSVGQHQQQIQPKEDE